MDAYRFWRAMNREVPGIFNQLDGWASHSYPNQGFIGKPTDRGRMSIRGYQWELHILKKYLGLKKSLPVFITETGWPASPCLAGRQAAGKPYKKVQSPKYYDQETVAKYIEKAYRDVWLPDEKIVAITPFVLNYHAKPLDNFSWVDDDGHPYPQYERVKRLPKKSWQPEQVTQWKITSTEYPRFMPIGSRYQGKITLKNVGQSIWGEKEFFLVSKSKFGQDIKLPPHLMIHPGQSYQFSFIIKTDNQPQNFTLAWKSLNGVRLSITTFNPGSISTYRNNFFQKIISLIKVWWYDKRN